ncbi:hypothetical protein [Streptomyces sp. CAI-85]|uniref:hypothetical protein n=1 Tax=Streptomyces sp. CAI-85 TaxID=1472662 RepID=UPI001587EBE8|nr:hypothetical protein [Streptomyces sp. CAI-85]NUV62600.1 hypothetical protein [Streptomyces sp. CAI-85]
MDPDRYGGRISGYNTPAFKELQPGVPRTVGVLDVDYARVAGSRLPEHWDIDVVGFMVMQRQESPAGSGREVWQRTAFHTYRDHNLSDLDAAVEGVDLVIGHNLFDGDYRCLRTYGDLVDVGRLVAKTVDTLYFARHLVTGGTPRAAGLDLTTLARAQGLRERAKQESRTEAHHGIRTIHDAEERWLFQPVSDDCELMLEFWNELLTSRRLRSRTRRSETVEHAVGEDELRLLTEPQLTPDAFTHLLTTRGTVYQLAGSARNESVARIHREIERQRAGGSVANPHPAAAHRQRCLSPGGVGERQCTQLIPVTQTYCRNHRSRRRCRGNPALDDTCTDIVQGDQTHCRWHRMTALYVPPGHRVREDFTRPVPLLGWDLASDWGYDTATGSFFARLYRNGEDLSAPPTVWLSGLDPELPDVVALTDAVAQATGRSRRDVVMALTDDRRSPRDRAVTTQDWEPVECTSPCPCGSPDCGHGEPCPNDECNGHDLHTMRNPTGETDVTAWQDHFECCEGCGGTFVDISLPSRPWGEVDIDAGATVHPGVSHYELGVYP